MAKSFSKQPGTDCSEMYDPIFKCTTLRMVMALVDRRKLGIVQVDVKSVFLNRKLQEELYIAQPKTFVVKYKERKVIILHKSLYVLRQAAGACKKTL